ncbi:MAG: YebC/PmpR family DNA-binding transcriptional regulator [Patescibacteria group bacterium]
MSGHSKWSNIKNRKAAVDAKKGKIFSQLARNIRSAVKEGKSDDPKFNASLRLLLEKARAANMPKEKVDKAIDVAMGRGQGANVKENLYEGFGPGGVGLLIVALTDNPNRTASDFRTILSKAGGSLAGPGSVKYMFSMGEDGEQVCTMPLLVEDKDQQHQLQELIDQLRSHDDVEDIYCAGEWPDKE